MTRRSVAALIAITLATVGTSGAAVTVAVSRAESSPALPGAAINPRLARPEVVSPTMRPAPSPSPASTARRRPISTVSVNGSPVQVQPGGTTAGTVVRAAGITVRKGRYLSVVHHRKLRSNGQPGGISVDGHRATLRTRVRPGDRVIVEAGPSRLEPTERVVLKLHPVVPSLLFVGARAGLARVVRGTISHEIVSMHVLQRPHRGHLISPGAVALTFDDGPSRHWTRAVLTLLDHHHVNATFCMIGRQIRELTGVVRRLVRDGNALCDHTWDHDLDLRARPPGQQAIDIHRGYHAIRRWTGSRPQFFRAPGGVWSRSLEAAARRQGMRPLKWTVDPRDWARPGVRSIVRAVMEQVRPGAVILLHDGGGNRRQTLAALRILLHRLPTMGYHFVLPPRRS